MTKIRKTMVVILLLLYVISSAPLSVFAVNEMGHGTVITEEEQQTVTENETEITIEDIAEQGTDEGEQEIEETEIDPVFDDSGYDFSDMAPDDTLYGETDYDYTDSMIQYDEFDDNIDEETFEPGYDFSSDGIALATVVSTRNLEDSFQITMDKTIDGPDFKRMTNDYQFEDILEEYKWLKYPGENGFPYFCTMQGSCFGDNCWYFSFTVNRKFTQAEIDSLVYEDATYVQEGYMIIKVPQNNLDNFLGTGTAITYFEGVEINKLNDMTYNTITGKLVIAACVNGDHDAVYTIDKAKLANTRKVSEDDVDDEFVKHNVSCNVTSIAFSQKDGCYIVGLTEQLHLFAKLDYDFNLIGTMGEASVALPSVNDAYIGKEEPWKRQTIFVDNNYIYNLLHLYDETADDDEKKANETENMIEIYDLSGEYQETIYFTVTQGTDRRYEAENINIVDGRLLIGFNCAKSTYTRDFCYYDLTEYGFSVTYCPDDDIATYITDGSLTASFVLRGFGAKLFTNPFSENGKAFQGWHAYRKEVDKWFYINDDKTMAWYKEGEQPEGYTKYLYRNKVGVKNTGLAGEHVYMCAQWADSDNFTVYFASPDITDDKYSQTIVHGTPTALMGNEFIKIGRTHKGWNAYWVEKKKWLYVDSATGKDLQWCVAGSQPAGYKKYVYSDGETVSKTVYKGNQVIMYAVWDEFFIYYNHSGRSEESVKQPFARQRGLNKKGDTNAIKPYSFDGFLGYNLYWRDQDKWLYYNSSTKDLEWFEKGQQTLGYSLYLKTFNADGEAYLGSTVPSGENLIMYAVWEQTQAT